MSTTLRSALEARSTPESVADAERRLADFWTSYVDSGHRGVAYIWRHPVALLRMLWSIRELPVMEAPTSSTAGGRDLESVLTGRGPLGLPARWFGTAVLDVPKDPDDYLLGRRAQTLRRKIRSAEKLGVRCELVTDSDERIELVKRANHAERTHLDPRYRLSAPDNQRLLQHDLWIKAVDANGEALLLAVAPTDGDFATLRYFRTLGSSPAHSDSRYLTTYALVRELAQRGVRYLIDTEPPGAQTNGLRHFQRMLGFRYRRIRLRRRPERLAGLSLPVTYASLESCAGHAASFPIF